MGCVFVMRAMMHVLNVPQFLGSRVILTFIVRGCSIFELIAVSTQERTLLGKSTSGVTEKKIILVLQSLARDKLGQIRLAILIDVGDFFAGPTLSSITSIIDYILVHFVDTVSSHVSKA